MIDARACAQISADIYCDSSPFDHRWEVDGVVFGVRVVDGATVLAFRGSVTQEDWMRNFAAIPSFDPEIGFVHTGFLMGMDEALAQFQAAAVQGPIIVTGHSLGGARARIAAAKLLVRGVKVAQVVTFGSPKPGFENVRRVLEKSGIAHVSYRNRNDPVPLVPFEIPLEPWQHTEQWIAVDNAPGDDDLDVLRDHGIERYVQALAAELAMT